VPVTRPATEPQRRCVGCGRSAPKRELLRLVHDAGRPVPDPAQRLPGRGAYVCRDEACIERAARRGGLARAFRRPVTVDARAIVLAAQAPPAGSPATPAANRAFSHNLLESIC